MSAISWRRVWELRSLGVWEWSGFVRKPRRSIDAGRAEFGLELVVLFNDGGFGDAELAANAGKAESANAEAAKFVFGFLVVHMLRVQPLYLYIWASVDFGRFIYRGI